MTTAADTILLALHAATGDMISESVFTESEITVLAWQADRMRFGLRGYETIYPNMKRVCCELIKMQEPTDSWQPAWRRLGLIRRVGVRMYAVTEAGVERARKAKAAEGNR
jgi:hypothetical protein